MCGIIGINENNEGLVRNSAQCFKYRGPDAFGVFADDSVTLGHNRLSIIDLDARSNQPMWDEAREVAIVFNGEIYNFKEIKSKLSNKYLFNTASDTEVLIYAYKEWGVKMSGRIQGMFAFAVYDSIFKKIILMRDHAGIKPLYYYAKDGLFVFASELKGIVKMLKSKNNLLELDRNAIDLYMALGYIPSPYTLYKNISKLPKSSYLEYDLKNKSISANGIYQSGSVDVNQEKEYKDLIEKKILAHLVSDVPVGVFFSGGTDSSLIAAILHKYNINLETFSIAINYKSDDQYYFNKISNYLDIKSHVYNFDIKEFDEVYEEVMSKIDEPTYDNSIFPTYFVSKKASEKVKVVLSGEGGDEFFYGYPRSLTLNKLNHKRDYSLNFLDLLFFALPPFKSKNFIFERLFIFFGKPMSFYLIHMSPARDKMTLQQWRAVKMEFRKRSISPLELDQEFYLENDLLRKIDFATSYASIEGRVPLLDIDIINNSKNFEENKLENGILKSFLKKILASYLPGELVYRNKSGFGINLAQIFKKSQHLKRDLDEAFIYLHEKGIYDRKTGNHDVLTQKYPNFCFALISLYRTFKNHENL